MNISKKISNYLNEFTQAESLAFFRFSFGLLMLISIVRFVSKGWVNKLYIEPTFHFSFLGFSWVKPFGIYTYVLFFICGLSALLIAIGYKYRIAIICFFLSFTYIELMDKTTYLNHYYFVSVVSFLLIFLPANANYSLDAQLNPNKYGKAIPKWTIDALKLMLCIVYFYAGLAKLNSDWLVSALPLKIWLSSKTDVPFIGQFLNQEWVAYFFSYFGAVYDLCIPFLLLNKRTRPVAFFFVVAFHIMTRILFPIGMFPYIMIVSTIIFFQPNVHQSIFNTITKVLKWLKPSENLQDKMNWKHQPTFFIVAFALFLQLVFPFRYLAYPGELFWTEQGYRFSWRVMLMEKTGYAQFKIKNKETGHQFLINNDDFLTAFQEKQMAFQPDFIVEFAHYLQKVYEQKLGTEVEVYVESYVSLNGRGSQPYIDPKIDLTTVKNSIYHKTWILPFQDEIKGF